MKLSEIRKACDAATPGPWYHDRHTGFVWTSEHDEAVASQDNCAFVALARAALPALLEAVDAWRQYEDSRHMLCSLLERAGIEVDE